MKNFQLHKKTHLLLFLLAFITSCNAQDSTSLQKDNTVESKSHPKIVKIQGTGAHVNVFCSMQDKSGNLWFGTGGEGVYRFDGKSFTNYTTKDGLNSNAISCVIEDKAGNILFGTDEGISRYDGKSFIDITKNTVLSGSSIYTMLEDKTGRLWVSDYKFGNYKLGDYESEIYIYHPSANQTDGEIFTNFLSSDSIRNDAGLRLIRTNCILEDRAGNIWFAGQNDEDVSRYDGKSITQLRFPEKTGPYNYGFRSILEDKNGKLWFGTSHYGSVQLCSCRRQERQKTPAGRKGKHYQFHGKNGCKSIMCHVYDRR